MDWFWTLFVEGQTLLELLKSSAFAIGGTNIPSIFLRIQQMIKLLN